MVDEKIVFMMPTFNTYESYEAQKKPKGRKKSIRGKTLRPIGPVLDDLISEIKNELKGKHEIVIINDGSTDGTKSKIVDLLESRDFVKEYEMDHKIGFYSSDDDLCLIITILSTETNQGLTPAVVNGFDEAIKRKPAYVLKLDSDGLHKPSDFPRLLNSIRKSKKDLEWLSEDDFGYGYRIIKTEALSKIMPDLKKFSSCLMKQYPDHPGDRRGIDRKTTRLINTLI